MRRLTVRGHAANVQAMRAQVLGHVGVVRLGAHWGQRLDGVAVSRSHGGFPGVWYCVRRHGRRACRRRLAVEIAIAESRRRSILIRWTEGWLPAQEYSRLDMRHTSSSWPW